MCVRVRVSVRVSMRVHVSVNLRLFFPPPPLPELPPLSQISPLPLPPSPVLSLLWLSLRARALTNKRLSVCVLIVFLCVRVLLNRTSCCIHVWGILNRCV